MSRVLWKGEYFFPAFDNMVKTIAIIGLGSIGNRYLEILEKEYPNVTLVIVRSKKENINLDMQSKHEIIYSIKKLLDLNVNVAIITSPSSMHLEQANFLVRSGIHVLIEKPLSDSLKGVKKFANLVTENGIVALVGYMFRFDPCALAFKNCIEKKIVGKVLHVRVESRSFLPKWRPGRDYQKSVSASIKLGGGVLLELSHELDYINWFFSKTKFLYAQLYNSGQLNIEVEESADLILKNQMGFNIYVHLSFNSPFIERKCSIIGSNGILEWDLIKKTISYKLVDGKEKIQKFEFERNDLFKHQINHFFDCVENRSKPIVSINDGLDALKLVEASKLSSLHNKTIYLK